MSEKINITKDAMKAEAKIRRIRANYSAAQVRLSEKYGTLELGYIATLTPEVRAVLRAAGVLASGNSTVDGILEASGEEALNEVLAALDDGVTVQLDWDQEEPETATLS